MASPPYEIGSINNLLHVALRPGSDLTLDALRTLWTDVRQACAQRRVRHVLIEAEQPAWLLAADEAPLPGELGAAGGEPALRVALCLYECERDARMRDFVERANRGRSSVQVFDDLGPALRWLGA